jgi:uncharacterized membrane protein
MDWLLTLCVIAASVLAARAFSRTRALTATILALTARVEVLDLRLSRFDNRPAGIPEAPPAEPSRVEAPLPEEAVVASPSPAKMETAPPALAGKGWEEMLVENWLVWLGGVALALGGAFLVKLSIDYGLLTPAVRVILGVLFGLALWTGAEWVVWGVPPAARQGNVSQGNVSQALAAAGAATIFASLYAAYQLYGLLPPALAFPLLALTAAATVLMSLQHGPFVAVLGLTGAFVVPAMVGSEEPSAFALFAYLILVGAGSLALLRYRAWLDRVGATVAHDAL